LLTDHHTNAAGFFVLRYDGGMNEQAITLTSKETATADTLCELLRVLAKIKTDPATIERNTNSMDDNNGGRIKF
jgi:hypothetical protein